MADIELEYGPGASIAILKQSLKALGLKAKLQVEVREVESGMDDALELRLGEGVGQKGMQRLEKLLQVCIRILAKRHVKMSANLGDRTIAMEIPPGQPAEHYKAVIHDFCRGHVAIFAPEPL